MLLEQIVNGRNEFRKDPNKKIEMSIATLLLGELQTLATRTGTPTTDEDVISVCRKIIKSNEEVRALSSAPNLVRENEYMRQFLPVMLSADELHGILLNEEFSNIGDGMKILNAGYSGQFDRGEASVVIRGMLSEAK